MTRTITAAPAAASSPRFVAGERTAFWAMLALAGAFFFMRVLMHAGYFAEDAYISFRFAEHLADGHGLVWNIGEDRVEGYTSPLHIAMLALGLRAGLPLPFTALAIGYLSVAGLVALFVWLLRKEAGGLPPLAASALFVFLVDARLAVHATAGLDTSPYMFLLVTSYAASLRLAERPGWGPAGALAALNLLCLLGRPDAAPFIVAQATVLLAYSVQQWRTRATARPLRYTAASYGLLTAAGAAYLAWKLSYFGYVLPNPYYIKANNYGSFNGLGSVLRFGINLGLGYGLILVPAAYFCDWRRLAARLGGDALMVAKTALLIVPPSAFLLYYTTVIPEVNYLNRFEYPVYFFFTFAMALFLAWGVPFERVRQTIPRLLRSRPAGFAAAAVCVLAVVALTSIYFPWFRIIEDGYYRPIGQVLRATHLEQRAQIVFDSAGVVPFVSRFTHIDPVGLTNNYLSGRDPITVWQREQYIWGRNPDVYIGPEPRASAGAAGCADDPIMKSAYVQEVLLAPDRYVLMKQYRKTYGQLSLAERCEVIHFRMRELRDRWTAVGEIRYPVPQPASYTTFAYARSGSPYRNRLVQALEPLTVKRAN